MFFDPISLTRRCGTGTAAVEGQANEVLVGGHLTNSVVGGDDCLGRGGHGRGARERQGLALVVLLLVHLFLGGARSKGLSFLRLAPFLVGHYFGVLGRRRHCGLLDPRVARSGALGAKLLAHTNVATEVAAKAEVGSHVSPDEAGR